MYSPAPDNSLDDANPLIFNHALESTTTVSKNFSRQDLRGCSFRGHNLAGADFSYSNIKGADFTDTNLENADFSYATAGLRTRWRVILTIGWIITAGGIGFLSAFAAYLVTAIFDDTQTQAQIAGWIFLVVVILFFVAAIRKGYQESRGAVASTFAFAFTVSFTIPVLICNTTAGIVAFAVSALSIYTPFLYGLTSIYAAILAGLVMLLGAYVSWRTLQGTEKDISVRDAVIRLATIKGTTFNGANLTGANFTGAVLQNVSFSNASKQASLTQVCWHNAERLDESYFGKSNISNAAVRKLLVTHNGYKKTYIKADFRGTNLKGVNLTGANLKWSDLSEANLRCAHLEDADLSEVLALGTDFRRANLTGACIEAWNIDSKTKLENVDCDYIYLLLNKQEKRPSSGEFAPGEFTKLFQEALHTVDLIFRNGVDWKAFVNAFREVKVENGDTSLKVQSIEDKGEGVIVVRVNVPPDTDKEEIHRCFNQKYENALSILEDRYQAELKAKDSEIAAYHQRNTDMWFLVLTLANQPINVEVNAIAGSYAMGESRQIDTGGGNYIESNSGTYIQGDYINMSQDLAQAADQIQNLLTQLQGEGLTVDVAQVELAKDIATQAQRSSTVREKLVKWGQSLGDATVSDVVKGAVKLAIRSAGIPLP